MVIPRRRGNQASGFEHRGPRFTGQPFLYFPLSLGPVGSLAQRADAAARHDHGPNERDGKSSDGGALANQRGIQVAGQVGAVVGGDEVGLGFVQAADRVAEEGDELFLRPAKPSAMLAMTDSVESLIWTTSR
jgi:hypothetical protein